MDQLNLKQAKELATSKDCSTYSAEKLVRNDDGVAILTRDKALKPHYVEFLKKWLNANVEWEKEKLVTAQQFHSVENYVTLLGFLVLNEFSH